MRVKVRGTKVILTHSRVPRWVWIATLLILWNCVMIGFFMKSSLSYALIVLGIAIPIALMTTLTETYVITDKEAAIVRMGKVRVRVPLTSLISFRVSKAKSYIFSFGRPVGDIEIYKLTTGDVIFRIKGVKDPYRVLEYLKKQF